MNIHLKKKIIAAFLTVIVCFSFTKAGNAFGSSLIKSFSLSNASGSRTEISIESTGKFKYFIHAQTNDLLIDIKGAKFSSSIDNSLRQAQASSSNVKGYSIEKLDDNIVRVRLKLKDIKDFKFTVNSEKGVPAPYGFNMKPKVSFDSKVDKETEQSVFKLEEHKKKVIKPSSKSINKPPEVLRNTRKPDLFDHALSVDDVLISDVFDSNETSKSSKSSRRLSESQIKIVKKKPVKPKQDIQPVKRQDVELKATQKVIKPEVKKPVVKAIPTDELLKRLTDEPSEDSMPRLVKKTLKVENSEETKPLDIQGKELPADADKLNPEQAEVVKEMVNSLQPLRLSGKELRPANKVNSVEDVQVIRGVPEKAVEQNSEDTYEIDTSKYPSRPVNTMSLGLAENYEVINEDINDYLELPKPKPAYNSDGSIAFKVVSSDGEYKGKVQVRKLDVVENQNKFAKVGDPYNANNRVSYLFKNLITKAKKYFDLGEITRAESAYERAISVEPEKPWGYIAIAGFYESVGKYEKALRAYEKADLYLPGKAEILFNIAMNSYRNGDKMGAINNLHNVVKLSPSFTLAYYNLGTLYYQLADYEKAVLYLKKAIALNPVLTDAHYNIGLAYSAMNNGNMAGRHFNYCRNIDSQDSQCQALAKDHLVFQKETNKQ